MKNHLPDIASISKVHLQPLVILDRHVTKHRNPNITEVLVQWSQLSAKEATWKLVIPLKRDFQNLLLLNLDDKVF